MAPRDSFVLLTPGVVPDGTFGLLSFRGIPGGNNFMTDGNDTTETFYNGKCRPHPHSHPDFPKTLCRNSRSCQTAIQPNTAARLAASSTR